METAPAGDVRTSLRDLELLNRNKGAAGTAEVRRADAAAREHLAAQVLALPPSAVVSKAALAAFKQRHIEMMKLTSQPVGTRPPF
mmetsp:Transcript_59552/g.163383  ORF Transcript_59552/g.163383 Transcript_59552/m.163383 type:complete len:85 (-) Transcript_59552:516-770(-)|eukprot:431544-Prymnesium_polylepis.2